MKKISAVLFLTAIALSLFLFSKKISLVYSAGQICCPDVGHYKPDSKKCEWNEPYRGPQSTPTACLPGETCVGSGGGFLGLGKGVCSENDKAGTGDECCPNGGVYNPDSNSCDRWTTQGTQSTSTACGPDQWCSPSGMCVTGTDTVSKPSNVTGATRPDTCGSDDKSIQTALGCIPTDPQPLISKLLSWGISMAGGIAFLLMLWAGFQYIVSTGNPEKLQEAQQILTSAIAGLLIIIFSVFLLRLIGVTVLQIPGFG